VSRAAHPPAARLAAVGAALSLVAATSPVAFAADPGPAPSARAATPAPPAKATPPAKASPAAPDEAAVDDDLIEFLGSIGDSAEEGDWLDFLSNTDIDKVAKRGSKTPPRDR
jgi:hypothetical protein